MSRRGRTWFAAGVGLAGVAIVGIGCGDDATTSTTPNARAVVASDAGCAAEIGVIAPYGDRPDEDGSIMNWARLSLDSFNEEHGTAFRIAPADVDTNVADGRRAARRLAADPSVVGVVGAKTSGVTAGIGPILDHAGLAYVSPTASAASLADGRLRLFHRVVPDDSLQAQAIGRFITTVLHGTRVVVVRNPEPYSEGLANGVTAYLRAAGLAPIAQVTVALGQAQMTPVAARIPTDADVVAIPMFDAAQAASLVGRIRAIGRNPRFIGGDALFVPAFSQAFGAFVSSSAPDIKSTDEGNQAVRIYQGIFGEFSPFGSPAYLAMQAVATAAMRACSEGRSSRAGAARMLEQTDLPGFGEGQRIRFLPNGNLADGKYFVYRVTGKDYELMP